LFRRAEELTLSDLERILTLTALLPDVRVGTMRKRLLLVVAHRWPHWSITAAGIQEVATLVWYFFPL
jgi:hypothetical protein